MIWLFPIEFVWAESATLELNVLNQEIRKGDEFEIELLITTDVTLGDFEGYLTYDENLIEFVTGASCITGGGGMLKIEDIGASKTNTTRRYLLRFQALQQGQGELAFYDTPMVYAYETGLTMSVSSNTLMLVILAPLGASSNAQLQSLRVNPGKLFPSFSVNQTEYEVTIPYEKEQIVISALAQDSQATVKIEGNTGLEVGRNEVFVKVKAEDGTLQTYILYVTREEEVILTPTPTPIGEKTNLQEGLQIIELGKDRAELAIYSTFTVLTEAQGGKAPTGYEETWINIDGIPIKAYIKREQQETEFYILMVETKGEPVYYRYDEKEQTLQRFAPEEITIKNVLADDTNDEVLYDALARYQSKQNVLLVFVLLFASTTAIAGIMAIRFYWKAKMNEEELGE